jgi:integrase
VDASPEPLALVLSSPAPLGPLDLEPARRFAASASSPETRRAYAREWSAFFTWCSSKHRAALPALPSTLAAYLAALAEGTATGRARKPAGIDLALAAITAAHRAAGFDSPREAAEVRAVRRGIRRELGTAQREAAPLLTPELRRALAALPATLHGARDRALLLLGWAGAFRRSALVSLDVADLLFTPADGVAVTLRRDKTDQEGRGRVVAIPFGSSAEVCPVRSVRAWLDAAGVSEGPIFRAVDRHGRVGAARLSDRAVALVVQNVAASIGLDAATFAGHSLRAGFATSAARAGKPDRDIMKQTGHRSRAMLDRYVRGARLWDDNAAAGLL